jgi:8-amino-7-oxononanoate synthase
MDFTRTLILTHRPVVDSGWFTDFGKIFYDKPNFFYGSKKNGDLIQTLEKQHKKDNTKFIYFASIQDLRGSEKVGGNFDKNDELFDSKWDFIIVDEAHATGVLGAHGEGLVCSLGLASKVWARVHTFGKALGCHGAVVVGSTLLRNYLINFARSFIYTTALPPHSLLAIQRAYELLQSPQFSNRQLHSVISCFGESVQAAGITTIVPGATPIQTMITGGNDCTRQLAATLQQAGLLVNPILHPTVPLGMERLRICLHSFNTPSEIDLLINKLSA